MLVVLPGRLPCLIVNLEEQFPNRCLFLWPFWADEAAAKHAELWMFATDLTESDLLDLCHRWVWAWCHGLSVEMLLREGNSCFFQHSYSNSHPVRTLALPVLISLLYLLFWTKKTKMGAKQQIIFLYQCFSLALAAKADMEAFAVIRVCVAGYDWGEMKQSVMRGQDGSERGERWYDSFSSQAAFLARLHDFPVRNSLEAKLEATTLTFTADFLHGLKICLGVVGTTVVTSMMLFSEASLYPNTESCFSACYMVICTKPVTTKECLL